MPGKDPLTYDVITYLWVSVLSLWGGVAGYIRKLKSGVATRFSISEIIGDIVISGFVGMLTFFVCEEAGVSKMQSAVIIAISAHMGCRALFAVDLAFDRAMQRWLSRRIDDI